MLEWRRVLLIAEHTLGACGGIALATLLAHGLLPPWEWRQLLQGMLIPVVFPPLLCSQPKLVVESMVMRRAICISIVEAGLGLVAASLAGHNMEPLNLEDCSAKLKAARHLHQEL